MTIAVHMRFALLAASLVVTAQARVEDILGGTDGKAVVTGTIDLEAYHTSDNACVYNGVHLLEHISHHQRKRR